ncbi:uncharacterized protein LOC143292544 isoform X2 [Babylonia areolata]|uniref:uncharacterized protein LOC143292544 isoform X2 n=1 Tax=Babylonia areolata TaxID=304850 RepID=UPI003FD1DF25
MWTAFVPRTALRMQTVITWRRPMDASLYAPTGNPCTDLLGNALCYIISGMMLLVVGVIITSLTFQNLEAYKDENKERYAGPVLIGAGVLVLARGAFSKLRPQRSHLARRRSFLRRYVREMYSRPILAFRNSTSFSLCDLQVSDLHDSTSRTRLYSDEPPPYDLVTSDHYLSGHLRPHSPHVHLHHHPDTESAHHHLPPPPPPPPPPLPPPLPPATASSSDGAPYYHHYHHHRHHRHHSHSNSMNNEHGNDHHPRPPPEQDAYNAGDSDDDDLQPPPHYEDFIRDMENMSTTRL